MDNAAEARLFVDRAAGRCEMEPMGMADIVYGAAAAAGLMVLFRASFLRQAPSLPQWQISSGEFILLAAWTLMGAGIAPHLILAVVRFFVVVRADVEALLRQGLFDLGILAGAGCGLACLRKAGVAPAAGKKPTVNRWKAGGMTFLASVPLTWGIGKIWEWTLALLGLPVERQRQFDLLDGIKSPPLFIAWAVVSAIYAPIAEEVMFRGGLFRYLRGRVPRWASLALPSTLFAFLHIDLKSSKGLAAFAPLAALGVIWSFAYERTGSILVSIVAHCLTNFTALAFFTITR